MTTPATEERFRTLVDEHHGIVRKICAAYCRNPADREDLAQEIALQLWRSFGKYDGRASFSTWMYRVALNVAISFYRRETRRRRDLQTGALDLERVPEREADRPENVRRLYEFIENLSELDKALVLLYLDGYAYREIADVIGISETNVATKLGRLKQRMKTYVAGAATREDG